MTELIGPFRKSSYSGQEGNCVEVAAMAGGRRAMRDSKNQLSLTLTFTPAGWQAFLAGAKSGEFGQG